MLLYAMHNGSIECLSPAAYAQVTSSQMGGEISGIVTDEAGPVIGAAVIIKGSQDGVLTGLDGDYKLSGLKINDIVVVSILGYETAEIVYTGQKQSISH